jgi:hypothetical protein
MSIFALLATLNLIFGLIGLGFGLFTWDLGLLVLAAVTMAQSAAWEAVDKMSDEVERLRNKIGNT